MDPLERNDGRPADAEREATPTDEGSADGAPPVEVRPGEQPGASGEEGRGTAMADERPSAAPVAAWAPPSGSAPSSRRRGPLAGLGVVVLGVLGFLVLKIAPGLVAGTLVANTLGSMFGGPYDRLPADFRNGVEARLEAAVPGIHDMDEAEISNRLAAGIDDGLLRLDDPSLTAYWTVLGKAMAQADVPTCARIVRTSVAGGDPTSDMTQLAEALDPASLQVLIETTVAALEASAARSPERRAATESQATPLFVSVVSGMTPTQTQAMIDLSNGAAVADEPACLAWRGLVAGVDDLAEADRALLLRYLLD